MRFYIKKEYQMSIASFLQGWGITNSRTREAAKAKPKYGTIPGTNLVRAPSGPEAARLSEMDGKTLSGNRFTVVNHKGGGVYEITERDW
jgi:hypothetical protein